MIKIVAPPSLQDSALLTTLRIGTWSTRRKNKTVSAAAANALHTADDAVEGFVNILPKGAMKPVQSAAMAVRTAHKQHTLPWFVSGTRLLPLARLEDHRRAMADAENEYTRAVESFLQQYPSYVQEAQRKLGSLFDPGKYPDPGTLRDYLRMEHVVQRLQLPDDLREVLPDHDELIRQAEEAYSTALQEALQDGLQHVQEVVNSLRSYAVGEKKRLHDSLVRTAHGLAAHVQGMASLLPVGNALRRQYEELAAILQKLEELPTEAIRSTDTAKDAVKDVADAVSSKLSEIDSLLGL